MLRRMKKSWSMALCAMCVSIGLSGQAGAVAALPFSATATSLGGNLVDFTLFRSEAVAFDSADLVFDFDPGVLALNGPPELGSVFTGSSFFIQVFNDTAGTVGARQKSQLSLVLQDPTTSTGSVLTAHFRLVPGAANGPTTVNFYSASSLPENGYVIPQTAAVFTVGAVPEPDQWLTMMSGLALLAFVAIRRRQ